jgi:adenosylcobinamide kinase/adenosylcobinamide-phosphate guanylyltransferase
VFKSVQLVIGGCRSGKSRQALAVAEAFTAARRIFIATCVPRDDEMRRRVSRHKAERDRSWHTVETPIELPRALIDHGRADTVVLVDCLTLWISNLLLAADDHTHRIDAHVDQLVAALRQTDGLVVLVSNEVGTGIVPENLLARVFRDAAGFANQRVAQAVDRVLWMVAGIPVQIKPAFSYLEP